MGQGTWLGLATDPAGRLDRLCPRHLHYCSISAPRASEEKS